MNTKDMRSSPQAEYRGEDPSALTENCDYPVPVQAAAAQTTGDGKHADDDDENDVAMPIPIATLVFQDGRTQPVYKPLAGLEHLFKAQPRTSPQASFSSRTSDIRRPIRLEPARVPGPPQHATEPAQQAKPQIKPTGRQRKAVAPRQSLPKSRSLKRCRSVAQGSASDRKAVVDNDEEANQTIGVVTEEAQTFYIGDVDAFQRFLHCRFDELTMKPLRGIVTHWVKLLEPRRLGDWGKYHEMLPSEADTPPWWPETVIYKEPSHLKKEDLSTLAVEMLLVHRKIDEMKRKAPWVTKLRDIAKFTIQTTSADHFSSSKGSVHSEEMKKRAVEEVLPSIFEVAQAYEDHVIQYGLFEGSGNVDPGRGMHHTWKPIPRPVRRTQPKRPRLAVRDSTGNVQETIYETSGDETEPDNTMSALARTPQELDQSAPSPRTMPAPNQCEIQTPQQSFSADDNRSQVWKPDTPVSVSGPCTPVFSPVLSQADAKMQRTASTPNSSFDRSLHGLHLGGEDMDSKPQMRTMSEQGNMHPHFDMSPYAQSLRYSATPAGYNDQVYHSTGTYSNSTQPLFAQTVPTFVNPFSMYHGPLPPMGYSQYTNPMATGAGFGFEQNMYPSTPVSFANAPMTMTVAPSDTTMNFDSSLPSEYPVDSQSSQELRQF
ncbi:hypothetical protein C7974DRAFT_215983 [Boeremia exigua]|uniref:uncharacterized protein n=1 Tax=Boeremia exigua TaxID=749465 RepID=UPI001E8DCEB8|nr:uncharacterized protein C7974DRAFT_215983 [Boeremia exigua]KAH6622096.1 hypothetical protein C7974DRAFT_215983 [Boeremia exigua]